VSFQFKPAIRESVGLILGLAGSSGAGKTFSALKLATGMAGGKPFALIDTEAGRARHYADQFKFDHGDLAPPFRPQRYAEAIFAADGADYPVIVVDSMSHEWAGEDGILDWHEQELQRMAGDDWQKREACKMAAWIKPKMDHKKMVQRLLQIRAHLILCFRAEEKVDMVRGDDGKMKIVPKVSRTGLDGWLPITEKALPYELTASFLLTADAPGVPKPIKLQEQHRGFFPLDKPISEQSGRDLAAWAKGAPAASVVRLSDAERDAHLKALETAASMPLLQAAFEGAWKAAARDGELRRLFKSTYDAALKKFSQGATANA
jgi:AAA domain